MERCTKKCFSKKTAQSVVNYRQYKKMRHANEKRSYYCEECNCWHVTSKEDKYLNYCSHQNTKMKNAIFGKIESCLDCGMNRIIKIKNNKSYYEKWKH